MASFEQILPPNRYAGSDMRVDINVASRTNVSPSTASEYEVILTLHYVDEAGTKLSKKFSLDATQLSKFSKQLGNAVGTIPKCRRYR